MRITNLKPLISEEAIQTRVKEMAGEISTLYKDEPLVVVCVLKGAFSFFPISSGISPVSRNSILCASPATAARRSVPRRSRSPRTWKSRSKASMCSSSRTSWTPGTAWISCTASFRRAAPGAAACGSGRQERAARGARHFSLRRVALPSGFVVGYGLDYAESYRNSRRSTRLK
mgnify:CR=1 FL=1